MPDPFITEQDVVDMLGRGSSSDPGMTIAVDAACDMVRTFTEQTINAVGGDVFITNGHGGGALLLPELPATQVQEVKVNGTTITDYVLTDNGILLRTAGTADSDVYQGGTWPEGVQNVRVTYSHGYAGTAVPRDLKMVALAIAERLVVQGPAVSEQVGAARVTYAGPATDLTSTEKLILSKYRQVR